MRRPFMFNRGHRGIILAAAMVTLAMLVAMIGASVAGANGVPFEKGDVLAASGNGHIKHFDAKGALLDTLETTSGATENSGMCFDAEGNLYTTNFSASTMSKFDSGGNLLAASFGTGFGEHDESCVVNAAQDIYVGQADGSKDVLEFNTEGKLLASFAPAPESRGTDWVDLASDQCTLEYTSEGSALKAYNVCKEEQLADIATGLPAPCYAHRILSDGSDLVACEHAVEHLNSKGEIIKTYEPEPGGSLFALNVDPDGETFWTAGLKSGNIYRINIVSGAVVTTFNGGIETFLGGLAVVGERTCAAGEITLSPATSENPEGATHTVTATVAVCGKPLSGVTVTFKVTGANPQTGTGTTNAAGEATFTYKGEHAGTDHIVASFVNKKEETKTSNEVTKIWIEDPRIKATGQNPSGTEGAVASGTVATFTDPDLSATASEYSASIEWGDGSSSAGTVSGSAGSFSVEGSHTYADEGSYPMKVVITDVDNESNSATTSPTAKIGDAALSASGVSATSPMAFSGTVAQFTDENTGGSAADFTATIEWGDGTSSTGTVSGGKGSYSVSGSHTYTSTGFFEVIVKIVDDGGSTAEAKSRILIFATTAGGNFVIGDGDAAIETPVTFWGARWRKLNSLSGGAAPAAFKGFANSPSTPPACGTGWSTRPGNSSGPPPGPLPQFIAVIVSSHITKSGPTISGDTPEVVVVKTNAGYAPNPGHAGTGTVVAVICHS
jgi:Bacterial Ig-like domain (group 1)